MVTEYFVRAFESNILACFAPNLKAISIQGVRAFDTGNGFSFIDILCSLLLHCRCSCSFYVIQESRIEENSAGIMVA